MVYQTAWNCVSLVEHSFIPFLACYGYVDLIMWILPLLLCGFANAHIIEQYVVIILVIPHVNVVLFPFFNLHDDISVILLNLIHL